MPEYINIFQPETEAESAVVQSFLRAEGIETYVRPSEPEGPADRKRHDKRLRSIWVDSEHADRAREIIAAYKKEVVPLPEEEWAANPPESGSFLQKIRNLIARVLNGS